jgi:phenylalanyl-tRNA synthetase beta chain
MAPSYRFDIEIEEDLIEEVARCHGFENIPANLPVAQHNMRSRPETRISLHVIREQLAASDYQEALNYSFVEEDWERDFAGNAAPVKLLNPIASQLAVMRSSLIGSLVANVRYNLSHKATRIRMFEIAKVYLKNPAVVESESAVKGLEQPTRVAAIAYGPAEEEQWGLATRPVDFFDVKRDLETLLAGRPFVFVKPGQAEHPALHPGRSAQIQVDGKAVGWIGELHPRWLQKYELPLSPVVFEIEAAVLQQRPLPQPQDIPKFPEVTRDLALVVEHAVAVQSLFDVMDATRAEALAKGEPAGTIQEVRLFDEYRGKGLKDNEKSLAFRFRLQDTKQTLNEEIIEQAMLQIITAVQVKLGATLRV